MTALKRFGLFSLLLHKGGAARYWEIDALRGVAIMMMVTYHSVYDLAFLGYYPYASAVTGAWRVFARATASLFILLVGVSLLISYAQAGRQGRGWALYRKYLARGLKLVGWGLVITLATWLYVGKVVVFIGILHLIGIVSILAYPFLSLRWVNLPLAVVMIALGLFLSRQPVSHPWLLWLGLKPATLFQLDYFPLLPWFGVALLGVFLGQRLYPGGRRRVDLPAWGGRPGIKGLVWLGRHSLAVYLLHQPILFALLYLANLVAGR